MKISFKKNLIRLFPNLIREISNNFQYNSFSHKIDKFDDFRNDYDSLNFVKKLESSFLISKKIIIYLIEMGRLSYIKIIILDY